MRRIHRQRGATLIDVIIIVAICVLLFGTAITSVARVRESAGRVKCASNLRQIGQALMLYANDYSGQFPRTVWDPANPAPVAYTGAEAVNPFKTGGPLPNDVSAVMYLLLRTQDLGLDVFVCPDNDFQRLDYGAKQQSNFPTNRHLAYSIANPFTDVTLADQFVWDAKIPPGFAVAADMNPGRSELLTTPATAPRASMKAINSRNHSGDGQNVLFGDGHAEFTTHPYVGIGGDNMYTSGDGKNTGVVGPPASVNDSILLPVATFTPTRIEEPQRERVLYVVFVAAALVIVVGIIRVVRRRMHRPAAD